MSLDMPIFVGFVDGSSHYTHNLSSATWVIYFPTGEPVTSGGACLGLAMNNAIEYSVVIELLLEAISCEIRHLIFHLNSRLVVL
jgi:ribonuclease HI